MRCGKLLQGCNRLRLFSETELGSAKLQTRHYEMNDIPKILAPIPAMVRHQTDATCCAVLMRDLEGEYHVVADGKGWRAMVVAAAGRILQTTDTKEEEQE